MAERPPRTASKAEFDKMDPQVVEPGKARTWVTRGGNFAVAVSEVEPGAVLERDDNPEEYMVILPPGGVSASIEAGSRKIDAKADSLTIVPPGPSTDHRHVEGPRREDLLEGVRRHHGAGVEQRVYADGAPELAPPDLWPEPHDGYRLRHYPLAQYAKPDGDRIQPRVFRSTNMLVNLFVHYKTRRETTTLSPHWHDDFEQASLTLNGRWVHHMRYNWGPDLEHVAAGRPRRDGHAVGDHHPATAVHTSRDVGDGETSLYDIFCPPRLDFARKKGFVINEDEYPMPDAPADDTAKTGGSLLAWQKPG